MSRLCILKFGIETEGERMSLVHSASIGLAGRVLVGVISQIGNGCQAMTDSLVGP